MIRGTECRREVGVGIIAAVVPLVILWYVAELLPEPKTALGSGLYAVLAFGFLLVWFGDPLNALFGLIILIGAIKALG